MSGRSKQRDIFEFWHKIFGAAFDAGVNKPEEQA